MANIMSLSNKQNVDLSLLELFGVNRFYLVYNVIGTLVHFIFNLMAVVVYLLSRGASAGVPYCIFGFSLK